MPDFKMYWGTISVDFGFVPVLVDLALLGGVLGLGVDKDFFVVGFVFGVGGVLLCSLSLTSSFLSSRRLIFFLLNEGFLPKTY